MRPTMHKISTWKLAQKLQASNRCGLIVGITIGIVVCLVIAAIVIKCCCNKKKYDCMHYDLDDFDCDLDEVACDENGCSYTSDKDFV